jgi:hypothetical protein
MEIRRLIGPAAALVLLGAIGGGIWYSHRELLGEQAPPTAIVRGLVGSEKDEYFADPLVRAALARQGLNLQAHKAGSREILRRFDPRHDDFGFPSGAPAAAELTKLIGTPETFSPFYTPIVIATWRPIAQILETNHIAQPQAGGAYYTVDLPALLRLIDQHARWKDVPGNQAFATTKAVLINSTDVRTSNSAAMYLALASYIANHESIIRSQAQVDAVLPHMAPLFLSQGIQDLSSAEPFQDYLALGMGKTPMLVAYEAQMVSFWLAHPDRIHGEMVMMYPLPTVYSKHVLVARDEAGRRLGEALEHDPELQQLAHDHGFRTGGDIKGPELWEKKGIHTPATLIEVIDPPAYEWLEKMITSIERQFPPA